VNDNPARPLRQAFLLQYRDALEPCGLDERIDGCEDMGPGVTEGIGHLCGHVYRWDVIAPFVLTDDRRMCRPSRRVAPASFSSVCARTPIYPSHIYLFFMS